MLLIKTVDKYNVYYYSGNNCHLSNMLKSLVFGYVGNKTKKETNNIWIIMLSPM